MSDVILYAKQKQILAKAVGKAYDALGDLTLTLAELGISPTGRTEKGNIVPSVGVAGVDTEDMPEELKKAPKGKKTKAEKPSKSKNGNGGSAHLTEM